METIIYTNSKREAANYEVDKISFADRVDIAQIIEEEMNRYNIRHLNLWFVSSNLVHIPGVTHNKLLLTMAKYLTENKDMSFDFQYLVETYQSIVLVDKIQTSESQASTNSRDNKRSFNLNRKEPAGPFDEKEMENQEHLKTGKQTLTKEEIIKEELKQTNAEELENFLQKQSSNRLDNDMVKNYIFKTKLETIKISFIEPNKKQLLKKIIDYGNDQIYDAKLHLKKKFTCLFEDHSSIKYHQLLPAAHTFHNKLILFLFQNDRSEELGRKNKMRSNFKPNYSTEALGEWKIKEENVNVASKLQRECELIKQEIESERIAFRNKIKMLENYIGQSINVEKLLQEEDDDQKSKFQPAQTSSSSFKKPQKQKKMSFSQATPKNPGSLPTATSQFKRIKEISDTMRNIDNTLAEQNRKIQTNTTKLKQLIKSKESLLYANARELNKIKADILQLQSEIKRKELEIDERTKNGNFIEIAKYKDKTPTSQARLKLEHHKQFINELKGIQGTQKTLGQARQPQIDRKQTKRTHEDKITHRSQHMPKTTSKVDTVNLMLRYKEKKLKEVIDSQIFAQKIKQQEKLRKRTLRKPFHQSNNGHACLINSQNQTQDEILINLLLQQLLQLYRYYNNNRALIKKMKKQIQNYRIVQHSRPFIFKEASKPGNLQIACNKVKQFTIANLDAFQQLNLCDFPILSQQLNTSQVVNSLDDSKSKIMNQMSKVYKEQSTYNRNYFDIMVEKENRRVFTPVQQEIASSVDSELQDKVLESEIKENTKIEVKTDMKFRPKRITIEQALKFNSKNLRISKIN